MGADFSSLPPCLGVPAGTSLPCVFPASLPAAFRPRLGHAARQRDGVRVRPYHFPEFAGRGSLRDRRGSLLCFFANLPGSLALPPRVAPFLQFLLHPPAFSVFSSPPPAPALAP